MSELLLTVVVILAIFFTVTNGVHAAGAVVATCIASGAATPVLALLIASVSALAGALTFGSAVAYTVSSIIAIPSNEVILPVLTAALAGSITWNCLTCKWGLPASSTHSLVGGLIGSAWISGGVNSILWGWGALTGPGTCPFSCSWVFAGLFASAIEQPDTVKCTFEGQALDQQASVDNDIDPCLWTWSQRFPEVGRSYNACSVCRRYNDFHGDALVGKICYRTGHCNRYHDRRLACHENRWSTDLYSTVPPQPYFADGFCLCCTCCYFNGSSRVDRPDNCEQCCRLWFCRRI